ncbi:hypothetical protein D3C80_1686630 [compost metagenome]
MAAGLGAHGGEGFHAGAVLLHVLAPGAAEGPQRLGHFAADVVGEAAQDRQEALTGWRAIIPVGLQRTCLHLFEAYRQHTIGRP